MNGRRRTQLARLSWHVNLGRLDLEAAGRAIGRGQIEAATARLSLAADQLAFVCREVIAPWPSCR